MAITNTLQRSINLATQAVRGSPLSGVLAVSNEPALSIGDWVKQFILAPPFAWNWNRNTATISATLGNQDYAQALSDFGWLEQASIANATATYQMEVALNLAEESTQNRPNKIAARLDSGAGTVTFRVLPPPDGAYTVKISYQKLPALFATLGDTWTPIPDHLSYLYNQGVLAKTYEYMDDSRYVPALQLFVRQVIAANAGLDDSQINIFLGERVDTQRQAQSQSAKSTAGHQGRGLF